jgi:very-short-patch-repair endonuclease
MTYPIAGLAFTDAEATLSELLDSVGIEHELNPRICGFRPDVWVIDTRLLIECDGIYHDAPRQRHLDSCRQKILERCGYVVMRFSNTEILRNGRRVLATILSTLEQLGYKS